MPPTLRGCIALCWSLHYIWLLQTLNSRVSRLEIFCKLDPAAEGSKCLRLLAPVVPSRLDQSLSRGFRELRCSVTLGLMDCGACGRYFGLVTSPTAAEQERGECVGSRACERASNGERARERIPSTGLGLPVTFFWCAMFGVYFFVVAPFRLLLQHTQSYIRIKKKKYDTIRFVGLFSARLCIPLLRKCSKDKNKQKKIPGNFFALVRQCFIFSARLPPARRLWRTV